MKWVLKPEVQKLTKKLNFYFSDEEFTYNEIKHPNRTSKIPEDLSTEELKKDSQKSPRQIKNTTNLINNFKNNLNPETKNDTITHPFFVKRRVLSNF